MNTLISLDLETYSKTDLLACGAYRYATCPSTDVLVASLIVNGRIVRWRPGQPHPFHGHPIDDLRIAAWNSQFERLLWWYVLSPDYDWPVLPLEAFQCTSAQARAMAAGPAKLETAARFFGRPFQKDMKGHRHMLTMCRPAPEKLQLEFLKSGGDPQAAERCHHTLAALDRLHDYCDDDTRTEHGIAAILPPWTPELLAQFHESERINDHGLGVDVAFARAAMDYAEDEKAYYARRMTEMTGGKIRTPRQFAAIKTWLLPQLSPAAIAVTEYYENGQKKTTLDADTRGNLLDEAAGDPEFLTGDSATGDTVLEFLEVLEGAGKSTISKYEAIANRAVRGIHDERPRVHGSYMYAGAAQSGRYSSTGIQLHNLVRKLPPNAPALIKAFKSGDDDAVLSEVEIWACALEAKSGNRASREPIHALGQLVRPTIRGCPKGDFDLVWGDWSSIEAVMLPWLSGDPQADAYLDVFRRGEDIYCHQASAILGRTITKADEAERQSYGKVPVLACLSRDTQVLTDSGVMGITEVSIRDKLWDGREWVTHQGVVMNGIRETISLMGVRATPDHKFLAGADWISAQTAGSSEHLRLRALETGAENLPCLRSFASPRAEFRATLCSAHAVRTRTWCTHPISEPQNPGDATDAQKRPPGESARNTLVTKTSALMSSTAAVCLIALQRASEGALCHQIPSGNITGGGGSLSRGTDHRMGAPNSFGTCSRSTVGMIPHWNWTVSTAMAATLQAISGSFRVWTMQKIGEKSATFSNASPISKPRSLVYEPVFDILNSGPHNRFTIISDRGPLIAHNCGYQGGVGAFQQMARGYGVRVDDEQAMHIVEGWRDANEWAAGVRVRGKGRVGGFWNDLNSAAMAAVADNDNRCHEVGRLAYRFDRDALDGIGSLYCRLPSGREIPYPGARIQMVEKFGKTGFGLTALKAAWRPKKDESEWPRVSLYGGILAENATQGSATGCLLNSALIRARAAGLTVCGHTHDEIIIESADPSRDKPILHTVMTAPPGWLGDDRLPLRADVDYGYRYKVKDTG